MAWLLSGAGVLLTFLIGPQANSENARLLLVGVGVALTTVGLAAAAGSQVMERQDRRPDRYRGPSPVLTFLAYFFAVTLVGLVALGLGFDGDADPASFAAVTAIQSLAYVAVVSLFVVRTGALSWAEMGWPTWVGREPAQVLGSIATAAVLMVPVTFAVLIFGGIVGTLLGTEPPDVLPEAQSSLDVLIVAIGAAVLAPIGEEVLFRGLAISAWRRDLGERSALVRSSVFFALVHILNVTTSDPADGLSQAALTVTVILPVGFVLGWMFLRRGLAGAIAAHATYNLILLGLTFAAAA